VTIVIEEAFGLAMTVSRFVSTNTLPDRSVIRIYINLNSSIEIIKLLYKEVKSKKCFIFILSGIFFPFFFFFAEKL
jgi:hypothetical protein